jgi:hypothetical protein
MSRISRRTTSDPNFVDDRVSTSSAATHPTAALASLAGHLDAAGRSALAGWTRDTELALDHDVREAGTPSGPT